MRSTVVVATLFLPLCALAFERTGGPSGSERFYQVSGGLTAITVGFGLSHTKTNAGGAELIGDGVLFRTQIEYGFNSSLAVFGKVGHSDSHWEPNTGKNYRSHGFNDVKLGAKYQHPTASGLLRLRAELEISPDDHKIEPNADTNNFTGGHKLLPTVAYEWEALNVTWGTYLSRDISLNKKRVEDRVHSLNYKQRGGEATSFGVFGEKFVNEENLVGINLEVSFLEDLNRSHGLGRHESPTPLWLLSLYAKYQIGSGELLPVVAHMTTTDRRANAIPIENSTAWLLALSYRFFF